MVNNDDIVYYLALSVSYSFSLRKKKLVKNTVRGDIGMGCKIIPLVEKLCNVLYIDS